MRFSYLRCAVTTDDLKRAQSYQHRRSGEGIVEKYFDQVRKKLNKYLREQRIYNLTEKIRCILDHQKFRHQKFDSGKFIVIHFVVGNYIL